MATRGTSGTSGAWRSAPPTFCLWRGSSCPDVCERYGTVGTCPAFSCASRAALSLASCVGSSLGTKVPDEVPATGLARPLRRRWWLPHTGRRLLHLQSASTPRWRPPRLTCELHSL